MRKLLTRLNFFWDDCDDIKQCIVIVPDNVTDDEVAKALLDGHEFLCHEDEEDIYGTSGRTPGTLLDYVCEKHGWSWDELEFDIDFNFE